MLVLPLNRLLLAGARHGIDRIDDGMVLLLARRLRLAGIAGEAKRRAGLPQYDPNRESNVQQRAQQLAKRCGVSTDSAADLMAVLVAAAHQHQHASASPSLFLTEPGMATYSDREPHSTWLRLLPPPRRWVHLLSRVPPSLRQTLGLRLLASSIDSPQVKHTLQPVTGRRLGVRIDDLGLEWIFELHSDGLRTSRDPAEVTVSGSFTDLLMLASRQQDADTLFFQRRLTLTGDTELGLMLRNLLDRLPWEALPLSRRILLQRAALLAARARDAHRGTTGAA